MSSMLFYKDSQSIASKPLTVRKTVLNSLELNHPNVFVIEGIQGNGLAYFALAKEKNLEGIVLKKADSLNEPKTKNSIRQISVNFKTNRFIDQWKEKQREIFKKLNIKHSDKTFMSGYRELPPSKDRFSRGIKRICSKGSLTY